VPVLRITDRRRRYPAQQSVGSALPSDRTIAGGEPVGFGVGQPVRAERQTKWGGRSAPAPLNVDGYGSVRTVAEKLEKSFSTIQAVPDRSNAIAPSGSSGLGSRGEHAPVPTSQR